MAHALKKLLQMMLMLAWSAMGWLPAAAYAQSASTASQLPYIFSVFPFRSPERIESLYGAAAIDFAKALNQQVYFRTKLTFAEWFEAVSSQKYDLIFIQPFDYIRVAEKYGYLPLAQGSDPLVGVLVVRPESPLTELRQLQGQNVALPPPSAAVSYLTTIVLLEAGLQPGSSVTLKHLQNHDACLQHLLIGSVAACGTVRPVTRHFTQQHSVAFRELAVTPAIPSVLFAVHTRVPPEDREAFKQVILGWSHTPDGQEFLKRVGHPGFVAASDADYDIVRTYARRLNRPE